MANEWDREHHPAPLLTAGEVAQIFRVSPKTVARANDLEAATIIHHSSGNVDPSPVKATHEDATQVLHNVRSTAAGARLTMLPSSTAASTGLTRVGAILGTPLYMSPEQCRGEYLDARSDIYSLGIITYQMLTGAPPFTGDTTTIIRAHQETVPPEVRSLNKKVSKRVSRLLMSALEKDPARRPQTAIAFANAMRANADGLGTLYRRAFALYSEYFPEFLKLSLLAHIPVIIVTLMLLALRLADKNL